MMEMWNPEKDLCRCCHSEGSFTSLAEPSNKLVQPESISEMLQSCFNIDIRPVEGTYNASTYTICEPCILRLRDASNFKQQVLLCEEHFTDMYKKYKNVDALGDTNLELEEENTIKYEFKEEYYEMSDDDAVAADDGHRDALLLKQPRQETNDDESDQGKPQYEIKGPEEISSNVDLKKNTFIDIKTRDVSGKGSTNKIDNSLKRNQTPELLQNVFICDDCGERFNNESTLAVHFDSHENLKQVNVSSKETINKNDNSLKLNQARVILQNVFICDDCGERSDKFDNKCTLADQQISHENSKHDNNLVCKQCAYRAETQRSLEEHLKLHDENRCFVCDTCGYAAKKNTTSERFDDKCTLAVHFKSHENSKQDIVSDKETINKSDNSLKLNQTRAILQNVCICDVCDERFDNKYTLAVHIKSHNNSKQDNNNVKGTINTSDNSLKCNQTRVILQNVFICDDCGERFDDKCTLAVHIKSHENSKQDNVSGKGTINKSCDSLALNQVRVILQNLFICDDCGERFDNKCTLAVHIKSHENSKQGSNLKCKQGAYRGETQGSLEKHLKLLDDNRCFTCNTCGFAAKHKYRLARHLRIHTGEKLYSCSFCGHKFGSKSHLTRHLKVHTGEKPYSCSFCEYKCSRKTSLRSHLRIHTGEKPYSCSFCEYKCSHKTSLRSHLRIHTGEKPYSCSFCEYECSDKTSLRRHLRIHTGEKPYSCSFCEYKCSRKIALTSHLRIHTGEKPYSCSFCKYKCSQKIGLTNHLRIHTGEKPYSCSFCEYKCSQKVALTRHLRIHTREKPYSCSFCEYKCSQKIALTCHLRIHTGEKPYSCSFCEYKCSQKVALTCHLRIHTGEKPYSCYFCGHKFGRKSHLTRHYKVHTCENPFPVLFASTNVLE